ncbi:FadR/GntR family transcriptional regulator [Salinarimonas soli]|uniref:FadR family transcriptional regulator n=1 Tax=Salinarimonas soli TaxID=1638099 RepID=A0A5B2V9D7_9HYPH|nr:FCD domain-containing protein [Salinarimonas soli]KAA2235195.1 FadR family transcriptional regulator [Salinarimonas soli]
MTELHQIEDRSPPRPNSPGDTTLAALRERLAAGEFVDGDRVQPERAIAEAMGVGRRAVRRALDVLAAEGRVWRRQGQGTFLQAPRAVLRRGVAPLVSPAETMEVRIEIEPVLARFAALRAAPFELERIREAAARCSAARDDADYERWDGAFHRGIAQAARNTLFLAVFDTISDLRADPTWLRLREGRSIDQRDRVAAEHLAISGALQRRDPAAAADAMRRHLVAVAGTMGAPAHGA